MALPFSFKVKGPYTCQLRNLSLRREKFEVWFGYQNRGELT